MESFKGNKRSNSAGRQRAPKSAKNSSNLTVRLDSYVKNLESERDFYKKEVDTLNQLLKSVNQPVNINGISHKSNSDSESKFKRSISHSPNRGANRCSVCNGSKSKSPSPNRQQQRSILKSPSHANLEDNELGRVLKERDELKSLLDKFERHMAEVKYFQRNFIISFIQQIFIL